VFGLELFTGAVNVNGDGAQPAAEAARGPDCALCSAVVGSTLDKTVEQPRGSAAPAAVADPDEHPSAGGSAGSAASSDLPATGLDRPSHATPRAAMHAEEVVRTRRFIQVAIALMAIAGGALVVVGGDPFVKRLLAGAMAVNTATLLVFLRYAAWLFLVGAELSAVIAERAGSPARTASGAERQGG